jgi:NADH dehydrogenase
MSVASSPDRVRRVNRASPRSPLFWLAVLRVLMGVVLLLTAMENAGKGLYGDGFHSYVTYLANGNPIGWYRAFLETAVLPNWQTIARVQSVAEPLMGLALIFGVFSPLAGIGGVFFFANLLLASWGKEWPWTYVNMIVILIAVIASGSGRVLGVDHFLARRLPFLGPLVRGLAVADESD